MISSSYFLCECICFSLRILLKGSALNTFTKSTPAKTSAKSPPPTPPGVGCVDQHFDQWHSIVHQQPATDLHGRRVHQHLRSAGLTPSLSPRFHFSTVYSTVSKILLRNRALLRTVVRMLSD